jgi:cytochrome c
MMPTGWRSAIFLAAAVATGCGGETSPDSCIAKAPEGSRVLVFTRTAGYRHTSIDTAATMLAALGLAHGWLTERTEDPRTFADSILASYDVVVFASTTGDVLDPDQELALQRFVLIGGGFVGIHSAADTEYGWDWYGELVGARFAAHPAIQPATVHVIDRDHLSTRCLPATFSRTDEWYDFTAMPSAEVLLTVEESSYQGGAMGSVHPITWRKRLGNGRSWVTAMGHTGDSYQEPIFQALLAGGISWAAGQEE